MHNSNILTEQNIRHTGIVSNAYVTIDGIVKYCITAPLLELPVDFKEWYKSTCSNVSQPCQI